LQDLAGYQDLAAYVSTTVVTGGPTLFLETAPSAETSFDAMWANALASNEEHRPIIRYATATVPLSRWVRWRLEGPLSTSAAVTFRIWLAANANGLANLALAREREHVGEDVPTSSPLASRPRRLRMD
jgi:hypothetical protein